MAFDIVQFVSIHMEGGGYKGDYEDAARMAAKKLTDLFSDRDLFISVSAFEDEPEVMDQLNSDIETLNRAIRFYTTHEQCHECDSMRDCQKVVPDGVQCELRREGLNFMRHDGYCRRG